MSKFDDYPLSRVPENKRLSLLSVAIVHMGMLTALDQFMLGAVLGNGMSTGEAFTAITLASLLFGVLTFALGYAGMREGLPGSLLARWCGFGRHGSVLIGLLVAISLLGWFGIQNAVFARSLSYALDGRLSFAEAAALSGGVLTLLVTFGFRALRFTARIAVPLFIALVGWIFWHAFHGQAGPVAQPAVAADPITVSAAITMVIGGAILASLMTPDLTRFSRNGKDVFAITLLTILTGEYGINGLAILVARELQTADIIAIITQTTSTLGLFAVVFSTLRVNDLNLYSSTLGISNAIEGVTGYKPRYQVITLLLGVLGTLCSILGILDRFVDFLELLGVVFPPVLGVMIIDYYVLKTSRQTLALGRMENALPPVSVSIGWPALIASLAGAATGLFIERGVPVFNSLIVACLAYLVAAPLSRRLSARQTGALTD
ncbi:cytosine permease [Pantoea graminicola]|uniref:cytosine permease n=1 Tax=Pantoea sp. ARC607 TaxID=2027922 RepID=UPI000DA986FC|nr:cytosine permease [Pantoea sp. ARC607]PZL93066.1 cytosine permease [Pantoea sp. ARC607]